MFGRANAGQWRREGFAELLIRLGRASQTTQLELSGAAQQHGILVMDHGCVTAALIGPKGGLSALRTFVEWREGRYTLVRAPIHPLPGFAALERQPINEQLRQAAQDTGVRVFSRHPTPVVSRGLARGVFEAELRSRLVRVFGPVSLPLVNGILEDTLEDAVWVDFRQAHTVLERVRDHFPEDLHPLLEVQTVALLGWIEQRE